MKAIIMVRNHESFADLRDEIKDENLFDAVEVLLQIQNVGEWEYGSFSTYEGIKSPFVTREIESC